MSNKVKMCDPDGGWRYGFPKALPDNHKDDDFDLRKWLVENGYPQSEIDYWLNSSLGYVPTRFWEEEDD